METIFYLKIFFTVLLAVLVPVYWRFWGPKNFLWFSDIALFGITLALWLESSLLASMMAVMVLWAEIAWNIDLLVRLITGKNVFGLTGYMFRNEQPLYVRLLSLFHVPLLATMIYLMFEWGYNPSAFYYQIPVVWLILILTYLAKPDENINWVYGWGEEPQEKFPPKIYFVGLLIVYPLIFMLSAHFFLKWLFA